MAKVILNIRVSPEVKEALKQRAEQEKRTVSDVAFLILAAATAVKQ